MGRFKLRECVDCGCCDNNTKQNMSKDVIPYYGIDHNYNDSVWQGEDPAANDVNIPALRAAKTSNGRPNGITIHNYPNKIEKGGLMKMYNSYDESSYICESLSEISLNEASKKRASRKRASGGGGGKASFATRAWNKAGDVMDTLGNVPEYLGRGAGAVAGGVRGAMSHVPGLRRFTKGADYGSSYVRKRFGDNRY